MIVSKYNYTRIGFSEMRNYVPRLEGKIIFDAKWTVAYFNLMRIIVSGAFRAFRAVKLITRWSLSGASKQRVLLQSLTFALNFDYP